MKDRLCGTCRTPTLRRTSIDHSTSRGINGEEIRVTVRDLSVLQCLNCGTVLLDEAAEERIARAVLKEAGYLTPEEIREIREEGGLSLEEASDIVGIVAGELDRIERGRRHQSRELDLILRAMKRMQNLIRQKATVHT